MRRDIIKLPEKGTHKGQLFEQWAGEFRQTHADHAAYIALHLSGALDACRRKLDTLMRHHRAHVAAGRDGHRHRRAIERLQNTMTGAAVSYETSFHAH